MGCHNLGFPSTVPLKNKFKCPPYASVIVS